MSRTRKDRLRIKSKSGDELSMEDFYKLPGLKGKKFKPTPSNGMGITKTGKLIAKNANRSLIKRKRQLEKQLINKELENKE